MAATAPASGILTLSGTGEVDLEDSNVSSPLSEFEDGDAHDDDIKHMRIDGRHEEAEDSSLSVDGRPEDFKKHHRSESESALSDAGSDQHSDANDTEAETERLYDSPKHRRQQSAIADGFSDGQVFEHTPSKLRNASRPVDDGATSSDDKSIASLDNSPTRPPIGGDGGIEEERRHLQERKRKRSPRANPSESEQPLRKRLNSEGGVERDEPDEPVDTPLNDDDLPMRHSQNGNQQSVEDPGVSITEVVTLTKGETRRKEVRTIEKVTRNGSKERSARSDMGSPVETPRQATNDEQSESADEEEAKQKTNDAEGTADEQDAATKSIEEAERKDAAFKDWTHIEEMFGIFRHRLYKDRIEKLEEEEQSLVAEVPTHPEYLNMKQCIDDRLERKLQETDTEFTYRLKALDRRAIAVRAQVWSQFFQSARERREEALESLNQQWYEVQTARRSAHSLPDYGLLFPKDQIQRVRNAIAYNTEVSTLAGLAKYEGFPAGPDLRGASTAEAEADLSAIEAVRRGRQKTVVPIRDDYSNPAFTRLGPAGEQFIKDTPWANPHHSAHKVLHQATDFTSTIPSNPPTSGPVPSTSGDTKSSVTSNQTPSALESRISESPELSRSILNPAARQMKRVSSIPNIGRGHKAAAA